MLGISPSIFWSLTWADLERLSYNAIVNDSYAWDRTRYVSTTILNSRFGLKPHQAIQRPDRLFPLFTDKFKPKPEPMTREQYESNLKSMKKVLPFNIR